MPVRDATHLFQSLVQRRRGPPARSPHTTMYPLAVLCRQLRRNHGHVFPDMPGNPVRNNALVRHAHGHASRAGKRGLRGICRAVFNSLEIILTVHLLMHAVCILSVPQRDED